MFNKQLKTTKSFLSLVKFSHTIFALPFALLGYAIASIESQVSIRLLILIVLCMLFARNAAMSFNRWSDRYFDSMNPRTRNREIPSQVISPKAALNFCIINAILFIITTWFINKLCFMLSPLALAIILGYSLSKRFTALSHFILGLGLSLAPTGAYLAVKGVFDIIPVFISLAVLTWVTGFDIIYSLQDDDFDRENNLKSIPVAIGRKRALLLSLTLHIITIFFLLLTGIKGEFHLLYWVGLGIFTILLFFQHTIVSANNLKRVNIAFFTTNGVASILFATFAITSLFI